MKKRMLSILLTLCMVLSLLPATALAGGVETEENYLVVSDWAGLLDAMDTIEKTMADPVYQGIKIKANNFGWPDEGGTLVIDFEDDQKTTTGTSGAGNQYYIYLVGDNGAVGCTWEIPANVTLQCYERLYLGDSYGANSTVAVNGKVEFMDYGTFVNNNYPYTKATVTVNGTLNTSAGTNTTNLTNVGLIVSDGGTLNVLYRCNLGEVSIAAGAAVNIGASTTIAGTLTLADGVHLTGQTLSLQGDLTTLGSAVVENSIQFYNSATLSGDLVLGSV